ncbi:hypothetical protein Bbelb_027800 [Branchiostoma belcheri]|nr:hypothetical protein Bbelb_027800 [Branchiostoma belcheri]
MYTLLGPERVLIPEEITSVNGYNLYRKDRCNRRGHLQQDVADDARCLRSLKLRSQPAVRAFCRGRTHTCFLRTARTGHARRPYSHARVVNPQTARAQANQPPIFTAGMDYLQIPEDTAVAATVYTLSATDADDDILSYGVSGQVSNNLFMVNSSSGVVILKSALDREVQQNPVIFITDANDNSPVFQGVPYEANVNENDIQQTSIFRVTATDADQGIGGTVSYYLEAGDETKFEVDRPTGVVSLKEQLDYETSSVYQLRIRAQDGGGSYQGNQVFQSSTTVLIVNVVDEDDQPPLFLGQPFLTRVNEDTLVGTSLITINARDGDYGINNPIIYSTEGDDGTFSIDSTTGVISLAKMLDRESKTDEGGVYRFEVQTTDNHPPSCSCLVFPHYKLTVLNTLRYDWAMLTSANTSVHITVVDVNDQIPTFYNGSGDIPQDYFTATIPEGTSAGISLGGLDMRVEDNDEGDNGRFTLTLDEEGSKYFQVVPSIVYGQTAVNIRVKNSGLLDYETLQSVQFTVIAREDLAPEHFCSNVTVLVTLEDTNDNSPVFSQAKYDLSVAENSPDGTVVGTIMATDLDSGEFGTIKYSLQGSGCDRFAINNLTGEVTVARGSELDKETIPLYFLTLLTEDGGGRISNAQLQITLTDVNDWTPIFYRSYHWIIFVRDDVVETSQPLQILAVDNDEGTNQDIMYSIVKGNTRGIFTIDEDSGIMNLTHSLDYEALGDVNECISRPCQNGGACLDGINSYHCHCAHGFTGQSCESDIDWCAMNPCPFDWICQDEITYFTCHVPGSFHENRLPYGCSTASCPDGMKCSGRSGSFTCSLL